MFYGNVTALKLQANNVNKDEWVNNKLNILFAVKNGVTCSSLGNFWLIEGLNRMIAIEKKKKSSGTSKMWYYFYLMKHVCQCYLSWCKSSSFEGPTTQILYMSDLSHINSIMNNQYFVIWLNLHM